MCPGHRQDPLIQHHRGQRGGPGPHPQSAPAAPRRPRRCPPALRWRRPPCRHRRDALRRGRHAPALQQPQRVQRRRVATVGAADLDTAGDHDSRNGRQPGTADADEVDTSEVLVAKDRIRNGNPHRAAPRIIRASEVSASREISALAAAPMARIRSESLIRAGTVALTQSEVRSASSMSRPPPTSTIGRALSRCSPLPIGSGTKIAGSPTAAASHTLEAPARHSTRSAAE